MSSDLFNINLLAELRLMASLYPGQFRFIFSEVVMRGRQFQESNSGRIVTFYIKFDQCVFLNKGATYKDFKALANEKGYDFPSLSGAPDGLTKFTMVIMVPNDETHVTDYDITVEIFKIVAADLIIENIIAKTKQMASLPIAGSCGYGRLSHHLFAVMTEKKIGTADWDAAGCAAYEHLTPEILKEVIDAVKGLEKDDPTSITEPKSAFFAQLTVKEIWPVDVNRFPGVLYYIGAHALLLDMRHRRISPTKLVPASLKMYMNIGAFAYFRKACAERKVSLPANYGHVLDNLHRAIAVSVI